SLRARYGDHAVLERVRGVGRVELQIELGDAELLGQTRRRHERRQSRGESRLARHLNREKGRVAPEGRRTGLDAFARQCAAELVGVVNRLQRSEATRTGTDAFELQFLAAAGAGQVW